MTSTSLQIRGEVDAAKRLLEVARKWHKSSTEMRKCIQDEVLVNNRSLPSAVVESAHAQVKDSAREVDAAESYLKEVEKKWEVIDVDDAAPPSPARAKKAALCSDDDSSGSPDKGSNKNEEASNDDNARAVAAAVADVPDSPKEATVAKKATNGDEALPNGAKGVKRECLDLTQDEAMPAPAAAVAPKYILVEGGGIKDVDGIYARGGTRNGAPQYAKGGQGNYTIRYGGAHDKRWVLRSGTRGIDYYYARADGMSENHPPSYWRTQRNPGGGKLPAPNVSRLRVPPPGARLVVGHGKIAIAIVVKYSWSSAVEGIYTPDVRPKRGVLSYSKRSASKGVEFVLSLREQGAGGAKAWYLSSLRHGECTDHFFALAEDELPPSGNYQWFNCSDQSYSSLRVESMAGTADTDEEVNRQNKRVRC